MMSRLKGRWNYLMRICKNCKYYKDETHTLTGVGIAYCDVKESRKYGKPDGSIRTVTYEDSTCRYWTDGRQMEMEL